MLKNHLKIAWRSLKSDRLFSGINILGLSVGLAIAILLFSFIAFERSFDAAHADKNIYRVLVNTGEMYENEVFCTAPAAVAPALKEESPDIKYAARMLKHDFGEPAYVSINNESFVEKGLYWCDSELFSIFNIEFLSGGNKKILERPNTVTLSESSAKKYFGKTDPIGQTIKIDDSKELEVVGVYKDFPENNTLDCNVIASFSSTNFSKNPSWGNSSFETYIQLNQNSSPSSLEKQMQQLLDRNVDKDGQWFTFSLQPMEKVHLYSAGYSNTYTSRIGNIREIKNLSFLALIILLIACINYTNLMTARSQKRAKDVGINKTLGASYKNLVARFFAETALITFIGLVAGIIIAIAAIPTYNSLMNGSLKLSFLLRADFLLGLVGVWLFTTLLSGFYPSLYLSKFSPKDILKPSSGGKADSLVRKGLVVVQFAASVILIVGVLVIFKQIQFMQEKNLGFNPENVIAISTGSIGSSDKLNALTKEFEALSSVSMVGMAQGFPGMNVSGRSLRKDHNDIKGTNIQTNVADANILDVLQLELLAGKTLPLVKQRGDTLVEIILNKKAVDYLGFTPEEAIGKKLEMQLGNNAYVTGVVNDFNYTSLHKPIGAYAFHNSRRESKSFMLVRFGGAPVSKTMNQLKQVFSRVLPSAVFDYSFLDKNIEKLYERERKTANIGLVFCLLAIFVACLGLFGLAAFMAEQRRKEIGVRKVLGASIFSIAQMLSLDFLKLVAIALLIAFPIAYFLMENWLQEFAYKISIGWAVFAISGICALTIALLTVSFQAVKAAIVNPIKSLRTE